MKLACAGLTNPGQVRKNNEDNFWVDEDRGLLLVADGMGGHAAGEVASQMAVDVIKEQVINGLATGKIPAMGNIALHLSGRAKLLANAVRMANEVIYATAQERVEKKGMGTTVVAVLSDKKKYAVAHVGDSRLYLFREGKLSRVTQDHSLVAEQVAKGLMTEEQAEQSDIKNILTRALGVAPEVDVDVDEFNLEEGDVLLLCTDGLCRMVDDKTIEDALRRGGAPEEIVRSLVAMANDAGGKDNVTVVLGRARGNGLLTQIKGLFNNHKGDNHG